MTATPTPRSARFSKKVFRFLVLITLIGAVGGFFLARWIYQDGDALRVREVRGTVTTSSAKTVCIQQRRGGVMCEHPVLDPNRPTVTLPQEGAHVRAGFAFLPSERDGARYGVWLYFEPI